MFYRAYLKISDPWQKWWCQQNLVKSIIRLFEKVLIWDLRKFLCLDLTNWSIYVETGESCCLKWSFSLTLCEIPWHFSSILPNVKISLTLCKIPWQFPYLEKFIFLPDISLTAMNPEEIQNTFLCFLKMIPCVQVSTQTATLYSAGRIHIPVASFLDAGFLCLLKSNQVGYTKLMDNKLSQQIMYRIVEFQI